MKTDDNTEDNKSDNIEQKVTPWDVEGIVENNRPKMIDYKKIIDQFGCTEFDQDLTKKLEEITKEPAHRIFRRGIAFAHRDFDLLLKEAKEGKPFYLYTGRGPSSRCMHLGHAIPFLLCKYFQDVFKTPLVIQITDDEKFLWKNIKLEEAIKNGKENIKEIIAFGFDPKLTYIFSNVEQSYRFEKNNLKISKSINLNEIFKIFGLDMGSNIGQLAFPAKEISPCFSSSFAFLPKHMTCLIPAAVDQDPFFRLARDKAKTLKEKKPTTLYVSLLPDIKGVHRKMSASDPNSSIYLTDTPAQIKNKINKYAFSGGRETLEEHKEKGGDIEVDVPYHYLRYFLEDDDELERFRVGYLKGEITTSEMKKKCIDVIQDFVAKYQEARSKITDEDLELFMDISRFKRDQFKK